MVNSATSTTLIAQQRKFLLLLLFLALAIIYTPRVSASTPLPEADLKNGAVALHSGPAWGYSVISKVFENQPIDILGRNPSGDWYLITNTSSRGWVSASELVVHTGDVSSVPITNDLFPGAELKPTVIIDQPRLGIHTGPDWGYSVLGTVTKDMEVIVLGRDSSWQWLFIWSNNGDGWVPTESVRFIGDISAVNVWNTPMNGAILKETAIVDCHEVSIHTGAGWQYGTIGTLALNDEPILLAKNADSSWVFIWSDNGDGWVSVATLSAETDLSNLPIWASSMNSATFVPTGQVATAALNLRLAPEVANNISATLSQGDEMSILGRNQAGTWLLVSTQMGDGWVYAPLVAGDINLSALAVK